MWTKSGGLGADDYISKPFSLPELVARVKANLSQYERLSSHPTPASESKEMQIRNIRLNPQACRVYVDDLEIECKAKEFDLPYFLMSNPEIVFRKETLYERIWGMDAYGDTKTVAVHIQTVWGAGYRFKV